MAIYRLGWKLHRNQVRLLLYQGEREILRARLPQAAEPSLPPTTNELVESLARWLDTTVHVVLCADDPCTGFYQGLTDERGTGLRTPYYEVSVVEPIHPRSRLRADREFESVGQLCLFKRARR
jgi:hypothetical protein